MIDPMTHKLAEAVEGQTPPTPDAGANQGHPSGSTPQEVAETTRREQASQDNGEQDLDRDSHLVLIGRAQQTHG